MPSLNVCHLIGNLTRDPELRVTPKGTAVTKFGLAINRTYKDANEQTREDVTFVDVEAWGKQAEVLAKYVTKGRPLYVQGRLQLDQWEDKTSGEKRSKLKVVLESFQFLGGRDGSSEGSQPDAPDDADQTRRHTAPRAPGGGRSAPAPQHDINDEDVPF